MNRDELTRQLAEIAVSFGANVQEGQVVQVNADHGHHEVARAVADAAYARGASYVDVAYRDPHIQRARVLHASDESLDYVPPWYVDRIRARGEHRCAVVSLTGATDPQLMSDLDPARVGRSVPRVPELMQVINDRTSNWTVIPAPNAGWAEQVFPDERNGALDRLWETIAYVCRFDDGDPLAAWKARIAETHGVARRLTERRFDAVHLEGPGTDLTIGLLPTSRWENAGLKTHDGIEHFANFPSEEVSATPDPTRADGVVTATKPLPIADGVVVDGLRIRFEGGRAVEIDAAENAEALRASVAVDEGAVRLGEVALVDAEGRVGRAGVTFFDVLLDENAASHLALGAGYTTGVAPEEHPRVNTSAIHIDFMVGSGHVSVTGTTTDGERVPVLRGGAWQL